MYRSLIVPLDGGSFGEYALPLALGIARRSGAALQLVHVCTPPTPTTITDDRAIGEDASQAPRQERAATYLRALAACLAARWDVAITTTLLEGSVADALQTHTRATGADLVVMTTHGHGPLPRIGLGGAIGLLVVPIGLRLAMLG